MSTPVFTVLMPVVRAPVLLPFAINSVLAQTRRDFELFIICDGAPPETTAAAVDAAKIDPRVRAFSFPKGEGHGEAYRHAALEYAAGTLICQIADDDLWFPDHLEQMALLLSEVEFGNLLHTYIGSDGRPNVIFANLAQPFVRDRMMSEPFNVFGPTVSGYRLSTYRRLPVGWSAAPPGVWSDLGMWRKFLALPGVAVGTRFSITSLHFPNSSRRGWSIEKRREEVAGYAERMSSPQARDQLQQLAFCAAADERATLDASLAAALREKADLAAGLCSARRQQKHASGRAAAIEMSTSWRITAPLRWLARVLRS